MSEKIKVDAIEAIMLEQQQKAIEGYKAFLQCNGNLKEYVKNAKVKIMPEYSSIQPPVYKDLYESVAYNVGLEIQQISGIASQIKTFMVKLKSEYIDNWRLCASMSPDHPDLKKREKFCKDYRANEKPIDHTKFYKLGTQVISNIVLAPIALTGEVTKIMPNKMMEITLQPIDKRRKKIIKVIDMNSLHVFPYISQDIKKEIDNIDDLW